MGKQEVCCVHACGEMSEMGVFAYLDPGSGSLLLQALVGGSAGLIVFLRHVWNSWVSRMPPNDENVSQSTDS